MKNLAKILSELKNEYGGSSSTELGIVIDVLSMVLAVFIQGDNNLKNNPRYFSCVDAGLKIVAAWLNDNNYTCGATYDVLKKNGYLKD